MPLAQVIHRIASDQSFANQFVQDPTSALKSAGLELKEEEVTALQTLLNRPDWRDLCSSLQADIEEYPWTSIQAMPPEA